MLDEPGTPAGVVSRTRTAGDGDARLFPGSIRGGGHAFHRGDFADILIPVCLIAAALALTAYRYDLRPWSPGFGRPTFTGPSPPPSVVVPPAAASYTPGQSISKPRDASASPEVKPVAAAQMVDVTLDVMLDEAGRPAIFKVVHGADAETNERAIEKAKSWQFRAGEKDGRPAVSWIRIKVRVER